MQRALRARTALAAAVLALFAAGVGCTLNDEYTSEYDGGAEPELLDSSALTDASAHADAATVTDAGQSPPDSAAVVDAGPYGDFCEGLPEILSPSEGGTVTATQQLVLQVPGCITSLAVYLDSNKTPVAKASPDGGVDGSVIVDVSISIPTEGNHTLNVNGWNHTNNAHASPLVGVTRTQ